MQLTGLQIQQTRYDVYGGNVTTFYLSGSDGLSSTSTWNLSSEPFIWYAEQCDNNGIPVAGGSIAYLYGVDIGNWKIADAPIVYNVLSESDKSKTFTLWPTPSYFYSDDEVAVFCGSSIYLSNLTTGSINVLSGTWYNYISSTGGQNVSGTINFNTKTITVDLTHIPSANNDAFTNGASGIRLKHKVIYGPTVWNVVNPALTTSNILIGTKNDTVNFSMTGVVPNANTTIGWYTPTAINVFLFPYHTNINVNKYFYEYAQLSAIQQSRQSYYNFNTEVSEEVLGIGNGSTTYFTGSTRYNPLIPGSVGVTGGIPILGGAGDYVFTDLGTGILAAASVSSIYYNMSGTVNYTNGTYALDFKTVILTTSQRIGCEYTFNNAYIGWKAQPIGGGVNLLSAVFPDAGYQVHSLATTVSGLALTSQNMFLSSTSNIAKTYSVSCFYATPGMDLTVRIPSVYIFSYEPIRQDTVEILQVSAGHLVQDEQILHMTRVIVTDLGRYHESPSGSFTWDVSTNGPTTIPTLTTGFVPADFTITKYFSAFNLPAVGYPGVSGIVNYHGTSSVVVTATDIVYGPEYVQVNFPLGTHQTFILTGSYVGAPTLSTIYLWKEYVSPTALRINVDSFINDPFIRIAQVKAYDFTNGTDKPIHYFDKVAWNVSVLSGGAWATEVNGAPYILGSGTPTNDTIIVYLSTDTFDNTPGNSAQYIDFEIQASAININSIPNVYEVSGSTIITTDTFPSSSLFYGGFTFNYEQSGTSDIWRLTSVLYPFSVADTTYIADVVLTGERIFNIFGTTYNTPTVIGTYVATVPSIITNTLVVSCVSASTWLDKHTITAVPLNVHFVTRFLSSDFIAYPSYVFLGNAAPIFLDSTNYTLSRGVCAYNHGHTETFNLSAHESIGVKYVWNVGGNTTAPGTQESTVDINNAVDTVGIPITLGVYNDDFPLGMPSHYYPDDGSPVTTYPNISTQTPVGDFSNPLFQPLRMAPYETPQLTVYSYNSGAVVPVPGLNQITALNIITFPVSSPVTVQAGSTIWVLSSPSWSNIVYKSGSTLSYTLSVSEDASIPGTVKYGQVVPVAVYSQVNVGSIIPYTPPFDWEVVYTTIISDPVIVSVSAVPNLSIFTDEPFVLSGETVEYENLTLDSPPGLISGFAWYDGYNPVYYTTGFNPFFTSYPIPGVYSVTLSAITIQGFVYSRIFPDIITVEPLTIFTGQIIRVFGVTELQFPNTIEQCRVAPNEWLTYKNMNNTFDKILGNIQYLKDVSNFYSPPPKYFIGWLGTTITDVLTSFHWNVNISQINSEYSSLTGALTNQVLSAVNDMAYKDDMLYIADGSTVQILSGNYAATPVSTHNEKVVGDPFIELKAIGVDSDTRIYLLDAPKNRVVVFTYNPNQLPNWKLMFSWGTLGGANARNGFNSPNDLFVDSSNTIWIVDTGNMCIKKYTRTGSWLQTYTSEYFKGNTVDTGGPISMTLDEAGNMYILVNDGIIKLSNTGEFINKFAFANEVTIAMQNNTNIKPKKIRCSSKGEFVYVCFTDRVVKITTSGLHGGVFADTFQGIVNFTSLFQNDFGDLFITNQNTIIKFAEENVILSVYEPSTYEWTADDIYVDKDEFIQPWVINRSLARIWDNIELFRRSISGKIIFSTLNNNISGYQVVDFTPQEYAGMILSDKEDIFVGVNEFVTRDVFNRCIDQLYRDQLTVLSYL